MTLQQIKYVLALDTYRHFVKAAESCFVTQSTLTIQIQKLEDEIGTILFDRTKQPLKPTPMGEIFIGKARQIDMEIQDLKNLFSKEYQLTAGRFKIGIIPTLSPYLLPLFLGKFLQQHPETNLEIEELESETIIEYLKQGKLDFAILSTPIHENYLVETPLFSEPFLLYSNKDEEILNKGKRISVKDLNNDKLWLLKEGHCFRNQIVRFCGQKDKQRLFKNLELEGGSIETLKRIIKATTGYTLIPKLSYDETTDLGHIKHFVSPEPAREIGLVMHKNFLKKKLIEDLSRVIKESIPKEFFTHTRIQKIEWR